MPYRTTQCDLHRTGVHYSVRNEVHCNVTSTSPLGIRGVATYSTKSEYSTTMHSVTLVSGNPNILIAAFSRAGSPKPSTTVRSTENDTRSATRNTESGAILTEWCVYFPGGASVSPTAGVTARPPDHITKNPPGYVQVNRDLEKMWSNRLKTGYYTVVSFLFGLNRSLE